MDFTKLFQEVVHLFLRIDFNNVPNNPNIQIGEDNQIQNMINHFLSDSNIGLLWIKVISIKKVKISPIIYIEIRKVIIVMIEVL